MCLESTTLYMCSCQVSKFEPCKPAKKTAPDSEEPEEPFCDDANIKQVSFEDQEYLCLDCHNWVRHLGGDDVLQGLYYDLYKLASVGEVTRFWNRFCKALVDLDRKEDFANRMRGVVRGQEPELDELALGLRKVNLAAAGGEERSPRIKEEN